MSSYKVEIVQIGDILPHGNADRLEIAKIYDWNVVVAKGQYAKGDIAVYVPVDSIISWDLEQRLFPPESKIKLKQSRVRSIRIRGVVSQGMLIDLGDVQDILGQPSLGEDVGLKLGISKYEPPAWTIPKNMQTPKKKVTNPHFKQYTDIENFKYYDRLFQDGEQVYVSEKLHGTSFRAGWFKNEPTVWWKKILKFFHLLPEWEFCWGSRKVQIQTKMFHQGYYDVDVYTKMVDQYNLRELIPKGYAIYGEIVGDGIQKGYTYGCGPGEHRLYVYDIQKDGEWLSYETKVEVFDNGTHKYEPGFQMLMEHMFTELEPVPCLYVGAFQKEVMERLRDGRSELGDEAVKEGVVIKSTLEQPSSIGRKVLKFISEDYYMKNAVEDGTDFH